MNELLKRIGITQRGYWGKDNSYIIDLNDSNTFGKVYSLLEKSDLIDSMDDNDLISSDNISVLYTNDEYLFNLIMNLEQDSYQLIVTEL